MRLIDADMIPNYKLDVLAKAGKMEVPCKFRIVHWKDIEAMPTIDPERLPVVQQLRAELEKVKAERDAAIRDIPKMCKTCRYGNSPCDWCQYDPDEELNWEWRGVKED